MSTLYAECSQVVRRLGDALVELERSSRALELEPLAGREWFELLTKKLVPQLSDDAYLVVAVVGGTNIGKSVVFNHIAGSRSSATSPLASGTKHPVCLVPEGFAADHALATVFEGFHLHEWERSEEALEDYADHRLFWRTSSALPSNLLVLDTPDVDSDAPINWQRADAIRRCADVLIAVLTQQKYNDAAVKTFFRKAASEDKVVVVVFNQCQLPEDEQYWPLWLGTFCRETGIEPELVYVAPNDRKAAESNQLVFQRRTWPLDATAGDARDASTADSGEDLMDALSRLHFAEIKLQTLLGSLAHLLDPDQGVPAYLRQIELQSGRFRAAEELLSAHQLAKIEDWPALPNSLLVSEIRHWWQLQREGWSAKVHSFYNAVGTGLTWPVRFTHQMLQGPQVPPLEDYRRREWEAILVAVGKVYDKLTWIKEMGNELLQPRLETLLAGTSRAALIETLQAEQAKVDLEAELKQLVAFELRQFREESPQFYALLRRLDSVAAAARPATSVFLFVVGFGPVGNAVAPLVTDAAIQTAVHLASDVAGGTVAAAVGETALSKTAASSAGYMEAKFRRLHSSFIARRAAWLAQMLQTHLLGTLPEELQHASVLPASAPFTRVETVLRDLERTMAQTRATADAAPAVSGGSA